MVTTFVTFTDAQGAVADPSTVQLVIVSPDGEVAENVDTFSGHQAASGYYEYDVEMTQDGRWHAEWRGGGNVTATEPVHWYVRPSYVDQAEGGSSS